ncbi:MAG: hypothetical protein K2I44_06195, partial [Muribaculaceae bacterium]|nr:hypothetical protein [Muribaculaceae bacterium]
DIIGQDSLTRFDKNRKKKKKKKKPGETSDIQDQDRAARPNQRQNRPSVENKGEPSADRQPRQPQDRVQKFRKRNKQKPRQEN